MRRGFLPVFAFILAAACIVYFTLPGARRKPRAEEGRLLFMRTVDLVQPPREARARGRMLRYERWLDRLSWGTSQSVNWTITLLVRAQDRSFLPEVLRRIARYRASEKARAKKYIDLLGELRDPSTLDFLADCAADPSAMVRRAALRALARIPGPAAKARILAFARDGEAEDRKICLEALAEDPSPEAERYFESVLTRGDPTALPYALKAIPSGGGTERAALIRPYLDHGRYEIRTLALQALLRMGDGAALDRLEKALAHPAYVIRKNAVQNLLYLSQPPPPDLLGPLTEDPNPGIRGLAAAVIGTLASRAAAEKRAALWEILDRFSRDERPEVTQKALEGLYRSGRREVIRPYLAATEKAYGAALKTAVTLLTDILEIEAAGPRLLARFRKDPDLNYQDRTALLQGMIALKYTPAVDLFFEVIRGRWDRNSPPGTAFPLHRVAAYKVHALGEDVLSHWLELLREDRSPEILYLFINGARNLEDPGAAEALLHIAADTKAPRRLRREAILSFAFLREEALGETLLRFAEETPDRELAECAEQVFWNFF